MSVEQHDNLGTCIGSITFGSLLFVVLSTQSNKLWVNAFATYSYSGHVSLLQFYIVFRLENKKNFPGDRCNGYFCLLQMYPPYDSDRELFLFIPGANVNATTATGDTPLSFACENGHTDVADVLLAAGAELVILCHHGTHEPPL